LFEKQIQSIELEKKTISLSIKFQTEEIKMENEIHKLRNVELKNVTDELIKSNTYNII
jgi:hypothetical protein